MAAEKYLFISVDSTASNRFTLLILEVVLLNCHDMGAAATIQFTC